MPRTARKIEPVEIPEPSLSRVTTRTWGEEFRAAYIQAKNYWEPGVVTYDAVAERVDKLIRTTSTSILRLGYCEAPPSRPNQRQIAYLSLVAMGFDPAEFGLEPADGAIMGLTDIELRRMLDPKYLGASPRPHED